MKISFIIIIIIIDVVIVPLCNYCNAAPRSVLCNHKTTVHIVSCDILRKCKE